jgi:hypothetical protein
LVGQSLVFTNNYPLRMGMRENFCQAAKSPRLSLEKAGFQMYPELV